MSTYCGAFRTNYFHVTDEAELRRIVGSLVSSYGVELIDDRAPYFAFGGDGSLEGVEDEEGFGSYDTMIAQLQAIVPEDEAIIIMSSGHEKLRYVVGEVTVITKNDCIMTDLKRFGIKTARELLKDPHWNSRCEC